MEDIRRKAEEYRISVYGRTARDIRINHNQRENQVIGDEALLRFSNSELQEIGYILSHMSRNPGLNAVIENDHFEYWAFVNVLTRNSTADHWIKEHNPSFVLIGSDIISQLRPQYNDRLNAINRNELLSIMHYQPMFPAVWAGFAYLEGVCRRICREYIDDDGGIKKAFRANGRQYRTVLGNRRAPRGSKGKTKISSLEDILVLTRRQVSPTTKTILKKFFKDYSEGAIYSWRNDCLHGLEDRTTVLIVQYCLIAILVLEYSQVA
jgi:hypothetical protein